MHASSILAEKDRARDERRKASMGVREVVVSVGSVTRAVVWRNHRSGDSCIAGDASIRARPTVRPMDQASITIGPLPSAGIARHNRTWPDAIGLAGALA